jgi:hypothetical protein
MNKLGVRAAMLVISLSPFLFSCEKEISTRGSGKKVDIIVSVNNSDYESDYSILRSQEKKKMEAETVHIPLNDNYFLAATLRAEPVEELRGEAEFAPNQKIRFMAFDGATEVGSAIYTWNGSRFVPDDEPLGVESDNDVVYHFVAYSFFGDPTAEPDDEDVEEGILPAQDLVWGEKDQKIYDNEADRTVSIVMKHQFSRVQAMVDASTIEDAQVTGVSGVVIAGGKKADLTVRTGSVAASSATGADVTAALENWTSEDGGKARLSGYKVFYPSLTTITFATLDITIGEIPLAQLTNQSVTFAQTLLANTNYRVVLDVRENRWAHSNIYWDDALNSGAGGLTFDKKRTNPSHADYQGVFFKWGSLVGISPVGDNTNAGLFIPDNIASRTWDATKNLSSTNTPWGSAGLNDVPSLIGPGVGTVLDTENHLYNLSDDETYATFTGDICKYLGGDDWRLPTRGVDLVYFASTEFISGLPFETGNNPNDVSGQGSIGSAAGLTYTAYGSVFFPASGYQHGNVGSDGLYYVGNRAYTADQYPAFTFDQSSISWNDFGPSMALSVRCIKKLPTD